MSYHKNDKFELEGHEATLKEINKTLEQRVAERTAALRESEERFASFMNNSPTISWMKDEDGRHVYLSKTFETRVGVKLEDWRGKTDFELWPKEIARELRKNDLTVLKSWRPLEVIEETPAPDGSRCYWLSVKFPFKDAAGKKYVGGIGLDITDRKKREEELYKFNQVLKALNDSSQAMVRATNEMDYLREVCRIIDKDCGYAMVWIGYAEDDEAKSVRPVVYAGFEEGYLETLKVTWADTERGRGPTGTAIRTGKVSMCRNMLTDPAFEPWRKEALKRGYASSIVLPLISGSEAFGALTIYSKEADPFSEAEVNLLSELANDLAYGIIALKSRVERERAEEQQQQFAEELKRSNADLEQFAYVASHDLREPLRAISGFAGLLGARYADKLDEKGKEYIKLTSDSAVRMDGLLTGLLNYSRVQTQGKEFSTVSAGAAFKASVANLQRTIAETQAVITSDELPTVKADDSQLMQLFQNLIGNAIKFRGEKRPEIHAGCQKKDSFWQFSVRDNGIGIDPQFKDRIFVIFQRLHTRDKYPGYGIGLTICKKIVERHGGKIWVESTPGRGSTFYFTVPCIEGA